MIGLLRMLARHTGFVEDEVLGLSAVVPSGATVLDIGAEYGLYTQALSGLVGPAGVVHSVEPLPGPFRLLSAGVAVTGRRNVRLHRIALGEHAGEGTLSLPKRAGLPVHGRAFLTTGARGEGPNREFGSSSPIPVSVHTLDELCTSAGIERLAFVKIDVEGAELAVLRGGRATLETHRPALLLEIEDRHLGKYGSGAADVVGWLAARGYTMHRWGSVGWQPADQVVAARRNYLFTPR